MVEVLTKNQMELELQKLQTKQRDGKPVYLFDRIRYFTSEDFNFHHENSIAWYHLMRAQNKQIIGMLKLEQNPHDAKEVWLNFVSVDVNYRNQGIAKQLLASGFNHVHQLNKNLQVSSYTYFGGKYIRREIAKLKQKYPDMHVAENEYFEKRPNERDKQDEAGLKKSPPMSL